MSTTLRKACITCGKEFEGELTVCPDDGTVLTTLTSDKMTGQVLADRYEILGVLGSGAMGTVYKAKHLLMKRTVAIKMLNQNTVSNAYALKRFQKEAQAASQLNHPNILAVYDFGLTADGLPYLAMDFLEGTNLEAVLEAEGSLKPERAVPIFIQAAAALAHAHQKGVIHRDLKPSNLMLVDLDGNKDFVKVVDFGIAKIMTQDEETTKNLTQTGDVFGSPLYMSPEQCRGQELDFRTDIYSLGCVMYKTLSGKAPLIGQDLMQCMYKQVNEAPAPFGDVCPELGIAEQLEAIVFKAMAKDVEGRWQSMNDLKQALEQLSATAVSTAPSVVPQALPSESAPAQSALTQLIDQAASSQSTTNEPSAQPASQDKAMAASTEIPQVVISHTISPNEPSLGQSIPPPQAPPASMQYSVPPTVTHTPGVHHASMARRLPVLSAKIISYLVVGLAAIVVLAWYALGGGPKDELSQIMKKAQAELDNADFYSAERDFKKAQAIAEKQGAPGIPQAAEALALLGETYFTAGRYKEAADVLQKALVLVKTPTEDNLPVLIDVLNRLAMVDISLNDFQSASSYLAQSNALGKKLPMAEIGRQAETLTVMARLATRQDQPDKAIQYATQSLQIDEKKFGSGDIETAAGLNRLGQTYLFAGDLDKAEEYISRSLLIRKSELGAGNPKVADCLRGLASIHFRHGEYQQSEAMLNQALTIKESALGSNNASVADILTDLAVVYQAEKQYTKAAPLLKRAMQIRQKQLRPDNPELVATQKMYANLQNKIKRGK
jgi:serine/threonine-protein kinase